MIRFTYAVLCYPVRRMSDADIPGKDGTYTALTWHLRWPIPAPAGRTKTRPPFLFWLLVPSFFCILASQFKQLFMETEICIDFPPNTPKYLSVSEAIITAIRDGVLKHGQQLPSINTLSETHLLSRDTVEKAYKVLRQHGIIESVRGRGYFIRRTDVDAPIRILLIFNKISNYKKQIYNTFLHELGTKAKVDLHIHHWNVQLLEAILNNASGQYDYYVIMPHFYEQHDSVIRILKQIPSDKLILLDRDLPELGNDYSAVYQDFRTDIIDALESAKPLLKKYEKLVYVNPEIVPYPPEIVNGFRNFCTLNDFDYSILGDMDPSIPVSKGEAYVVIEETDLVNLVKICKNNNLQIGRDIGIISYNETPLKEIFLGGITVISTDHEKMGRFAAHLILNKQRAKVKNPFTLIQRGSL